MTMELHQLSKPAQTIRSKMWALFRQNRHKFFRRYDIQLELELDKNALVDGKYLRFLTNAGILEKAEVKGSEAWRLCKDMGIEAPRFHKDGTLMTQTGVHEAIWRSIRILKSFNRFELAAHVSGLTNETTVKTYIGSLHRAGYLSLTQPKRNAHGTYRLVRDTGPKPPQILKVKEVYDPNIDEIVMREVPDCE